MEAQGLGGQDAPSLIPPEVLSGRLLVVEDDLALKPIWDRFIAEKCPKIHLVWAVSAEAALERLRFDTTVPPFDIVAIDIFLSGAMTGLDLVDFIRSASWSRSCEIILTSSCDPLQLRLHLGELNFRAQLLPKPYFSSSCMSAVISALGRLRL